MRIYLPLSQAMLRALFVDGRLPGPLDGCAVTPALREWFPEGDDEELEYAAQYRAADLSIPMIVGETPARRVVLAVDADAAAAVDVDDMVGVRIADGITLDEVAAVLADAPEAEAALLAAIEALSVGDEDVPAEVEALDEHGLAWFDPDELPAIVARIVPPAS
jgi:hypothetical protein